MKPFQLVRTYSGVPPVDAFNNFDGTPIVINETTGDEYALLNGAVTQVSISGSYPRSANTVLAGPTSGAAAAPTFRALVGADLPQPTLITSGSFPAANNVDIANIPQTFSALHLAITGASFDTATRRVFVQVSTDNGSTFDTTAANYVGSLIQTGTAFSTSQPTLIQGDLMAAAGTCTASVTLFGYQAGQFTSLGAGQSGGLFFTTFLTYIGSSSPINALRILNSGTGNFDAGTYALYGI